MSGEKVSIATPSAQSQTIFTSATLTTTTAGSNIVGIENYSSALFFAQVSAVTGTTPTFDIYVQGLLPDGTTFQDLCHFTQITGTANRWFWFIPGASQEAAVQTSALAAGSSKNLAMPGTIRVNVVITGTNPSGLVKVTAHFYN